MQVLGNIFILDLREEEHYVLWERYVVVREKWKEPRGGGENREGGLKRHVAQSENFPIPPLAAIEDVCVAWCLGATRPPSFDPR